MKHTMLLLGLVLSLSIGSLADNDPDSLNYKHTSWGHKKDTITETLQKISKQHDNMQCELKKILKKLEDEDKIKTAKN